MYRDVQINTPMFIGIILLVAVVTAVLVYGVNVFIDLMHNKSRLESIYVNNATKDNLRNWFADTENQKLLQQINQLHLVNCS